MTEGEKYIRLAHYWKEREIRKEDAELLRSAALSGEVSLARFYVKNGQIIPCAKLTDSGRFFVRKIRPGYTRRATSFIIKKITGAIIKIIE